MTLTLPPGRQVAQGLDRGRACAASSRFGSDVRGGHARRRVDDEHDVPREPRRPLQERPRREQREDRRRAAAGAAAGGCAAASATARWPRRRRRAGPQQRRRHDGLVAPQLEQVHRDDRRDEQQPEQRERGRERHRAPTPARGGGGARRTSGRPGSRPTAGRRSSPVAWPRGRRSPPSRPRGGPCRRRSSRGRR